MADYFTHFSCLLDVGTPDNAARALALFQKLRAADHDADDPEVAGFTLARQDAPKGSTLWIHDDDQTPASSRTAPGSAPTRPSTAWGSRTPTATSA